MTEPALEAWPATPDGFARSEVSAVIGTGDEAWARATRDLLRWRVKTASGFIASRRPRCRAAAAR